MKQDRAAQVWKDISKAYRNHLDVNKGDSSEAERIVIDLLAAYGQEEYRAGVEKMRDELCEVWPEDSRFSRSIRTVINQEANKLLAQTQEDKS